MRRMWRIYLIEGFCILCESLVDVVQRGLGTFICSCGKTKRLLFSDRPYNEIWKREKRNKKIRNLIHGPSIFGWEFCWATSSGMIPPLGTCRRAFVLVPKQVFWSDIIDEKTKTTKILWIHLVAGFFNFYESLVGVGLTTLGYFYF